MTSVGKGVMFRAHANCLQAKTCEKKVYKVTGLTYGCDIRIVLKGGSLAIVDGGTTLRTRLCRLGSASRNAIGLMAFGLVYWLPFHNLSVH